MRRIENLENINRYHSERIDDSRKHEICGNFTYFEKRCRMMDVVMRKSNGTLTDPSFSINDTFYPPVISDWQWKIP